MLIPAEFDEIRPYTPEELPEVYEELIADPLFKEAVMTVHKDITFEALAQKLRVCQTNQEVQNTFFYPLIKGVMNAYTDGTDMNADNLDRSIRYTFISNHRDIVIDSAFLCVLLLDNQFPTTIEIAIGDNLLTRPWIKKIVRINKSFIVQRSLSMRQKLESSIRMSRYMHYAIQHKHENIWIAQREGRAKDSNDVTQDAVLKMMAMGGEGSTANSLRTLNITPLTISYEYDPCDFLKAQEFQEKRDHPNFKKRKGDDLLNMNTGIFGYKGHVHYQTANCINSWLDTIDCKMTKNEFFSKIAQHIDHEIHRNYRLYGTNYMAADLVNGTTHFASHYNSQEKVRFEEYINERIALVKCDNPDPVFLREKLLWMYANPVFNYLKATTA
ncbi:MAG: acyltransferase [Bacteroidaceae bacterium]